MQKEVRAAGRATWHLARAVGLLAGSYFYITVLLVALAGALTVIGIGAVPEAVLVLRRIASAKRNRTAAWTGTPIPEAYRLVRPGVRGGLATALRDPCTAADLRWLVIHYAYGLLGVLTLLLWPAGLLVDGVGCGLLRRRAIVLPLIVELADLDARWSTVLLRPPPRALLAARVDQLTETRAEAVAAHEAELRRIERDLHDGVQAQLVSLSMRIGLARATAQRDPENARTLLDGAQNQIEQALAELRQLVRGIHPPVLTDRGLGGAIYALAAGSTLRTRVSLVGMDDHPRPPAAIEAALYFVTAEALTNAAKHSGGDRVDIELVHTGTTLHLMARDDGHGGADAGSGTGISGMRRRIAALDGTFVLLSPPRGPTTIEVLLPCGW